jgi:hypothetical protein
MEFLKRSHIEEAYKNHATLLLYYGMRALVIFGALLFLLRGDWESFWGALFVAALMSVPGFIKSRYRIYLPFSLDLGIVSFIFLTLFLGGIEDLYGQIHLWDKLVHFQSGLLLSITGFVLVYSLNEAEHTPIDLSPGFVAIFAVVFSLAIGAVWEIIEFAGDAVFRSSWQNGLADTMWDLIADGGGALVISIIGYFWMYRHKRLPFTPRFLKLIEKARKVAEKSVHELRR